MRALTGPSGCAKDRDSYEAFGSPLDVGGGLVDERANPLAFTGEYLDPVTELYDLRARDYDPTRGRFLQRDPLGLIDEPATPARPSTSRGRCDKSCI
jgi:RHS repeat-associated protein